jgi:hypothetical protein
LDEAASIVGVNPRCGKREDIDVISGHYVFFARRIGLVEHPVRNWFSVVGRNNRVNDFLTRRIAVVSAEEKSPRRFRPPLS